MSSNNRSDAAAFYAKHRGGHISDATKKTLARVAKMEAQELKPMLKNEADDDDGGRMKNEMVNSYSRILPTHLNSSCRRETWMRWNGKTMFRMTTRATVMRRWPRMMTRSR